MNGNLFTNPRPKFVLRPYQQDAVGAIQQNLSLGINRMVIAHATGTGKTVVMSQVPGLINLRKRLLVLAHREELLDQARDKFERANPELTCEIEQAKRRAGDADIVIASVPTLQRKRLERFDPSEFGAVIIDECHHAIASTYVNIIKHFGCDKPNGIPLIGFTATPKRGDNVGLSTVFDAIAHEFSILDGIKGEYLAPILGEVVKTGTDLSAVRTRAGDFAQNQLTDAIDQEARNELIISAYFKLAKGRRTLAFAAGVSHAEHIAEMFNSHGVRAATVSGETDKDERRQMLADFARGDIQVMTNCGVLTEGYDDPGIECIIMARPTKSSLLYTQMLGRGTRTSPSTGKKDCLVLDFTDNAGRHSLCSVASLFGLPEEMDLEGKAAHEVKRWIEDLPPWIDANLIKNMKDLEIATSNIDFFTMETPGELEGVTQFVWMQTTDGSYSLDLPGKERMEVSQTRLDTWKVLIHMPDESKELGELKELRQAIQVADNKVRSHRPSAVALVNKHARWRTGDATEKQIALLQRLGIPVSGDGMSKGQASYIIGLKLGMKR